MTRLPLEEGDVSIVPRKKSRLLRALPLLGVAAVLLALAGVVVWVNPLGLWRGFVRLRLSLAGLDHRTMPGPRGPLSYWVGGAKDSPGPMLVLVHGLGNDAGVWAQSVPALLKDHRLIVIDLPGHGGSAPRRGPLSIPDEVAGLEALLAVYAGAQPPILIGNSLGGWVALLYAERHPERVSRLVLVDTAGLLYEPKVRFLVRNREEARALTHALLGPRIPPLPGFLLDDVVEKLQAGPAPRIFASFARRDFLDGRLAKIATPTDLIWGSADGLFPPDLGRRYARELPQARFHLLDACGHTPQAECPAEFVAHLLWVLKEPPPGPIREVPVEPWRDPAERPPGR
ncbi:MAG TPA: alpha/beta fold hydrolase [Thermoanaerobaculia bacterium]|jgi:pimeloyl-ACP methyl ester carboxylesterase|nr:alpha/beta fold hydrolase [Thermoanaerobaculia bacterium]